MIVEIRKSKVCIANTAEFLDMVTYTWNTRHIDKGELEITQRDIVIGNVEPYTKLG